MDALERNFYATCDDKGIDLECPTFPHIVSISAINEFFCDMHETINNIADKMLNNDMQSTGSGVSSGAGASWAKSKKKRKNDNEETSSGVSY